MDLVVHLDAYLRSCDGNEHAFYDQYNNIDKLSHVIVSYVKHIPLGCGALKSYDSDTVEIKRMYVCPEARRTGMATQILKVLEQWAKKLDFKKCILETGKRQPEAIAFYTKNGYNVIPNYGQYQGVTNSVCFQKLI